MGMTSKFDDVRDKSSTEGDACTSEDTRVREWSSCSSALDQILKDDSRSSLSPAPAQSSLSGGLKKPSEVFRTDFIAGMKISESQSLPSGNYIDLKDTWRTEWEKGVQVPVNPHMLPEVKFRVKDETELVNKRRQAFHLPESHISYENPADAVIRDQTGISSNYDLDEIDTEWIKGCAELKQKKNEIDEITMERAITYFERKCFENMVHAVTTKEGLSIEYDESTICDVCLSPDTEEGNEIVFCDACNMCAHQVCYGLLEIPHGNWLCRPCSRGILSPPCVLCPNRGGALKRVKDSYDWVHVICAWWIPEVKIEDTENIENVTVNKIPQSRWNLTCSLCREKMGACVQCSVKRCVRAYHITCAVKEGLEMKTVVIPEKDDVQHISYCGKHCIPQPSGEKKSKGEIAENQRLDELKKLETEFYKLVTIKQAARDLHLSKEAIRKLYCFWTLKRKANDNVPLIPLTAEQKEQLSGKQGIIFIHEQMNMEAARFTILRQDLERLRNLCYMIVRRERVRRELHRASFEVFYKQHDVLTQETLSPEDQEWVTQGDRFMRFVGFPHYTTKAEYELLTDGHTTTLHKEKTDSEEGTELTRFRKLLESGRYDVPKSLALLKLDGLGFDRSDISTLVDITGNVETEDMVGLLREVKVPMLKEEEVEKKKKKRRRTSRYSYDPPKKKKKVLKRVSEPPVGFCDIVSEDAAETNISLDPSGGTVSSVSSTGNDILPGKDAKDEAPIGTNQIEEEKRESSGNESEVRGYGRSFIVSEVVTDNRVLQDPADVPDKETVKPIEKLLNSKDNACSTVSCGSSNSKDAVSPGSVNSSSSATQERESRESVGSSAKVLQDSENIPKNMHGDIVRHKWSDCQSNGDINSMDFTTESENVNFGRQKSLESNDRHCSPLLKDGQVRRSAKSPNSAKQFSHLHSCRRLSPRLNKFAATTLESPDAQQIIDKLKADANHVITVEDYEKPQRMTRSRLSLLKALDGTART